MSYGFDKGHSHHWLCDPHCATDHRTGEERAAHPESTRYAITAQYQHHTADGYTGSTQIPTFYLYANVQGIMDEAGAERVAREILTAGVREMPANDQFHITATRL